MSILPPLPPVIREEVPVATQVPAPVDASKRFVLCITKDLSKEDERLLESFGKVLRFDSDTMSNMDPCLFEFSYLIVDYRKKNDRYFYMKHVKAVEEKFNVVLFCHSFESDDMQNENHYDNMLFKLPAKQARKNDFDALLLVERIKKPRWYMSLASCLFKTYHHAK